jgi:hypothetical protein
MLLSNEADVLREIRAFAATSTSRQRATHIPGTCSS